MKRIFFFIPTLFLCCLIFSKCNKNIDNNNTNIPYVQVNEQIHINQPAYFDLLLVGGWVYISGGSMGIIVYKYSNNEFKAYDRHSPYQAGKNCLLSVDLSNILVTDKCSASRFFITNGGVERGPAIINLKEYQTSFDGSILHIYN